MNPLIRPLRSALLLGIAVAGLAACGAPKAEMKTPDGMVQLRDDSWSPYDWRATSPTGVVLAARLLESGEADDEDAEVPEGNLSFWADAVKLRLRTQNGYALLEEKEVRSADGVRGTQLRFGRDQDARPFLYWVTLYVTDEAVHVIEAGGRKDLFEAEQPRIEKAITSYRTDGD